jgi:hypothetical protein
MDCQTDSLNNDQRIAGYFVGNEEVDNLFPFDLDLWLAVKKLLNTYMPSSDPLAKRMVSTKLAFRESNPRVTPASHKQKPPEQTF